MNIIGIDPGLDGALAVIEPVEKMVYDTPTFTHKVARGTKRVYDLGRMVIWLQPWADQERGGVRIPSHAFVENIHSMPGQGVRSMFSMGYGVGAWHGILTALGIDYTLVTPQKWKAHFGLLGQDKDAGRRLAQELWPDRAVLFERKKDDGRADAMLIAEYGRHTRGV
jgi:crossover junction endodeoxyribonuclease RuvC